MCDGFEARENLLFLQEIQSIHGKNIDRQKLIISVDLKTNEIDQLSYEIKNNTLEIYVAPKQEMLRKENVKIALSPFKYDSIVVIDTPDLESLGPLYEDSRDLFQSRPIINMDSHPSNENFGQINCIDLKFSSTAEIIFSLLKEMGADAIDSHIATCLLAGIMAKTKSFTVPNLSAKTLEVSSELIELGAERNTIVKNIFRNKKLSTLNLWGRVLARIKVDDQSKLAWSIVPEYDFIDTGTAEKNLEGISDEFIKDLPETEYFILFYQKSKDVRVVIKGMANQDVMLLAEPYKPEGTKNVAKFTLPDIDIADAEKKIIGEITEKLKK